MKAMYGSPEHQVGKLYAGLFLDLIKKELLCFLVVRIS